MLSYDDSLRILDSINGLVVVDIEGKILFIDKHIAAGMEISIEECMGRHVNEILPLSKLPSVIKNQQHEIADSYYIKNETHWQYPIVVSTRHPIYEDNRLVGAVEYDLFENYHVLRQFIKTTESITNKLTWFKQQKKGKNQYSIDNLIGSSAKMQMLRKDIFRAANSQSTVLIYGETGSGKELVAHSIHYLSKRKQNPFVSLNCSAIPGELFESELFGYEEGAFTGANKGGKAGKFEIANKGTLFLDEINTLPIQMQPKLLRVLQEQKIDRVGNNKAEVPIDVRIVCATNQDLESLVDASEFREDLFFRLNVVPIKIPPLRDHMEDIEEITYSIIGNLNSLLARKIEAVEPETFELLKAYDWPGNIRELQNVLERAMHNVGKQETTLKRNDFKGTSTVLKQSEHYNFSASDPIQKAKDEAEKEVIIMALKELENNKSKVAEKLRISRASLYRKIYKYNIKI